MLTVLCGPLTVGFKLVLFTNAVTLKNIVQWQIDKTVYVAAETTQLLQKVLFLPF